MKRIGRSLAVLISLLFTAALFSSCGTSPSRGIIPDQADAFYVYDEAGVLDDSLEKYIVAKNVDLYSKCGGQIVVSCVETTGDTDISDYAYMMFNKWHIGSADKNNGVLILLSIKEDDYWVLQGQGLEDLLQSGTLKLMCSDFLEPYFAKGEYGNGVRSLFDALTQKYEQIYSISVDEAEISDHGTYIPPTPEQEPAPAKPTLWNVISVISYVIVGFAVAVTLLIVIVSVVVTVFIIIGALFSASSGPSLHTGGRSTSYHRSFGTGSFTGRTSGRTSGWSFGGSSFGRSSGRSFGGRSSGGSFGGRSSGGSFGGSHHSGGGGSSRGGGAGRR